MQYDVHAPRYQGDAHGSILVVTVVFVGLFSLLFGSLLNYLLTQYHWAGSRTEEERALDIAEAGVEYYRWHLAHYPDDLRDGTGAAGPYVHVYEDPEVGPIGEYSLQIGGETLCGHVQVVHATSTGHTYQDPSIQRTIVVKIARPTVADYSYVVDSNVWAGSDRTIIGPYHSNGVIRMDGDNHSAVTSKIGTTSCSGAGLGGCSGTIAGVYGTGDHPEWWRSAQPDIPFTNFDYDFGQMESLAQSSGIKLNKISNDATGPYGYSLVLQSNGTGSIYRVTSVTWIPATTPGMQSVSLTEILGTIGTKRQLIETRTIPTACPLIYASDRVWLEGTVSGKVTVVANDTGAAMPDLFLQNNLTYGTTTGRDGVTVLAERNLLIPLYVPDTMNISGVFIAQKGSFGRAAYDRSDVSSSYRSYITRTALNTTGTVVSKLRTGTRWSGTDPDPEGFLTRNDYYDRSLAKSPPALTPFTSPDFHFIEWREVQ